MTKKTASPQRTNKTIKLEEILNEKEIKQAQKLYTKCQSEKRAFAKQCADYIIQPRIKEINDRLGQKNDPLYLAYCVEFCLLHSKGTGAVQ